MLEEHKLPDCIAVPQQDAIDTTHVLELKGQHTTMPTSVAPPCVHVLQPNAGHARLQLVLSTDVVGEIEYLYSLGKDELARLEDVRPIA